MNIIKNNLLKKLEININNNLNILLTLKKDIYNLFMIKKIVGSFNKKGSINTKLLMNNLIIAINTFGVKKTNEFLFILLNKDDYSLIKSCLCFLNIYPENINEEHSKIDKSEMMIDILNDMKIRYNIKN
jgi:hypothetical protein